MSGHAKPAYADFAVEIHVASDDERTSLHNAEPGAQPHSDGIRETEWTDHIEEGHHVRRRLSSVVSIFRVPKFLKDTKKEAYVPQRVSLGPYHHGSAELRPMGHHKGRALRRMMESFNTNRNLVIDSNNMDFADLAREEILKLEDEIRDSYEENIDCHGETLARMLILDGCFILEVLRNMRRKAGQYYEPIFGGRKLQFAAYDILYDILMLENQVPLIVLRKLQELEINSAIDVQNQLPVEDILYLFNPFHAERFVKQWYVEQQVHHLLGFLYTAIVSPPFNEGECVSKCSISIKTRQCIGTCIGMLQDKNKARDEVESIPHAVELKNAGIKFKRFKGGIKEIKFDPNSATIFLPRISIQDSTEMVFRNLIAFEMCKPFEINYVSHYVRVMDDLIDSHQDVALLGRMGVLTNRLGSDKEVADLFNGLGKRVTLTSTDVFDVTQKVNAHYNNEIKVQIAKLVEDHFSSPWKALALVAAIVALLLTAVQTIFPLIHK